MTGFGRSEYNDGKRNITVEIKAVNHRYSDVSVKMPRRYGFAEDKVKAAVKGNNKLSFKEADTLIEQLLQAKNPYTCPHGRPTIISLSKYELEKKFKRIQS